MLEKLPINFAIIRNPVNWAIVVLMVIIAGYVIDILARSMSLPNE